MTTPALEWVRLEQSAVQKRDPAELPWYPAPRPGWSVQRAEKERLEEIALEMTAGREASVGGARQEVGAAVEPALALHEVQEEDASELEERDGVAVAFGASGNRLSHAVQCGAERPEEPPPHRLTLECLRGPCGVPQRPTGCGGRERQPLEAREGDRVRRWKEALDDGEVCKGYGGGEPAGAWVEPHNSSQPPPALKLPRESVRRTRRLGCLDRIPGEAAGGADQRHAAFVQRGTRWRFLERGLMAECRDQPGEVGQLVEPGEDTGDAHG
jgi:hypothetical protein